MQYTISEKRKVYLSMAKRKARPGSGSHLSFLRERSAHYGLPELNKYLEGVTYAIVGGLATRLYMPERATLDSDVLVLSANLPEAESVLVAKGVKRVGALTVGGSTWHLPDGSALDVLAFDDVWVADALTASVVQPNGLPYITLPYLVLMKLVAGHVQDLADITRMLGCANEGDLQRTRDVVKKHSIRDCEDLESMIQLGKLEYDEQ